MGRTHKYKTRVEKGKSFTILTAGVNVEKLLFFLINNSDDKKMSVPSLAEHSGRLSPHSQTIDLAGTEKKFYNTDARCQCHKPFFANDVADKKLQCFFLV